MIIPSLILPPQGTKDDQLLVAAERVVRDYCGWHIAPVIEQAVTFDGSGAEYLFLRSLRVVDVISVTENGRPVDVDTLEWSQDGFLRAPRCWTSKLRGVKVTYSHGFEDAPGVAEIVNSIAGRAGASPAGVVREQAGQVAVTFAQTASGVSGGVVLMAHERAMLDRYKLFGGA